MVAFPARARTRHLMSEEHVTSNKRSSHPKLRSDQMLPFFAYGTLLPGQPNFDLWQQAVTQCRPAVYPGGILYDLDTYPMLLDGGSGQVVGMLMQVDPVAYPTVLRRLDELEGFDPRRPDNSVFQRRQRPVTLPTGEQTPAWVYLGRPALVQHAPVIPHGDWVRHTAGRLADMRAWWDAFGRHLLPPTFHPPTH